MPASKFMLRHDEIEVIYTVDATPGVTALVYHDGYASAERLHVRRTHDR